MKKTHHLSLQAFIALLLVSMVSPMQGATSDNEWTISLSQWSDHFRISRRDYTKTEKVYYRAVGISAYEGLHFGLLHGSIVFTPGKNIESIEFVERNNPYDFGLSYRYQTGPTREYRFEVLDEFGNLLASYVKTIDYDRWQYNGKYLSKSLNNPIYFSGSNFASGMESEMYYDEHDTNSTENGGFYIVDDGYDYSRYRRISTTPFLISTGIDSMYCRAAGYKVFATLGFTQREKNDGYQYIQILVDNNDTYDGKDPDGKVNTPSKSIYKACFELSSSTTPVTTDHYQFFPHRYDYKTKDEETAAHIPITEFSHANGKLYAQAFQNSSYRAPDAGALILDPSADFLTVRYDANGSGEDTWLFKDLFFRFGLYDNTPPSLLTTEYIRYSKGPNLTGNQVTLSVPFNEIVLVTGTPTLSTSWGTFSYDGGSGSNVVSFTGNITAPGGTELVVDGLTGTIKDLVGNTFTWTGSQRLTNIRVTPSYTITYNLNGGTADNPARYWSGNSTFTLTEPIREGYLFVGWTGSNGNTPQTTVTITSGSTGDRTYTANWKKLLTNQDITVNVADTLYDGTPLMPAVTIMDGATDITDLCNIEYSNNVMVGNGIITITPKENAIQYTGTRTETFAITVPNISEYWGGGNGSADAPYIIDTTEDLDLLAAIVNYQGKDFYKQYFELGADITYDGTENNYTPIAHEQRTTFEGYFNGKNHTISGINITKNTISRDASYLGVFGWFVTGSVTDLTVSNCTFIGYQYIGGIAGSISATTVRNCRVDSSVVIKTGNARFGDYYGGIAGNLYGNAKVEGCISAAVISDETVNESDKYGGLFGEMSQAQTTVKNCLFTGNTVIADNRKGAIIGNLSAGILSNNYYTCSTLPGGVNSADADGARLARTITLGDAHVCLAGSTTTYDNSGLTAIGTAALRTADGFIYSGEGQTVTLGISGDLPQGFELRGYAVNGTPIEGDSFTMPAEDVTVTALLRATLTPGDLNGDGNVDVSDVSLLINVALGKEVTLAAGAVTDLSGDGNVDVTDVSLLINIIMGRN